MKKMVLGTVLAVTAVITVQAIYWFSVSYLITEWTTRGQFGDLFGGLNAVFSGLAFMSVAYTINLNHKQIERDQDYANFLLTRANKEDAEANINRSLELLSVLMKSYQNQIDALTEDVSRSGPLAAETSKRISNLVASRNELDTVLKLYHAQVVNTLRRTQCTATL